MPDGNRRRAQRPVLPRPRAGRHGHQAAGPAYGGGIMDRNMDLIVIGAGPAGLSAACAARACGLDVTLVDGRARRPAFPQRRKPPRAGSARSQGTRHGAGTGQTLPRKRRDLLPRRHGLGSGTAQGLLHPERQGRKPFRLLHRGRARRHGAPRPLPRLDASRRHGRGRRGHPPALRRHARRRQERPGGAGGQRPPAPPAGRAPARRGRAHRRVA